MRNFLNHPRRLELTLQLAVIAAVVAVFWPVVQADFVHWDDGSLILNNPHLGLGWNNLRWMFTDASYTQRYLPLGWLSYSIDQEFFHGSSFSYHLGNLLFHIANTILVYTLVSVCSTSISTLLGTAPFAWSPLPLRPFAGPSTHSAPNRLRGPRHASTVSHPASFFYQFSVIWASIRGGKD